MPHKKCSKCHWLADPYSVEWLSARLTRHCISEQFYAHVKNAIQGFPPRETVRGQMSHCTKMDYVPSRNLHVDHGRSWALKRHCEMNLDIKCCIDTSTCTHGFQLSFSSNIM